MTHIEDLGSVIVHAARRLAARTCTHIGAFWFGIADSWEDALDVPHIPSTAKPPTERADVGKPPPNYLLLPTTPRPKTW